MSLLGGVGGVVDPVVDGLLGGNEGDTGVNEPGPDAVAPVEEVVDGLIGTGDEGDGLEGGGSLTFGHGTSVDAPAVRHDFSVGEEETDFLIDSERAYAIAQQAVFMARDMVAGLAAHTEGLGVADPYGLEAATAGVDQASPLEQYRESQQAAASE
ncbi:hypothetical protein [Amaricoccus tamworthensis]|uniref:hypothetical protein n=1 Tax=Amaricoccus tamworthensis TaxID=57002 RepID=UPI003C7B2BAB